MLTINWHFKVLYLGYVSQVWSPYTLCWGRATGVIWEKWNLPVSGPPRAGLNSSRLVKIPSCWVPRQFPWLVFWECKKIDIILRQVKRKRKKKKNCFPEKNLLWALDEGGQAPSHHLLHLKKVYCTLPRFTAASQGLLQPP